METRDDEATDRFCLQSTMMCPAPPHRAQMMVLVTIVCAS